MGFLGYAVSFDFLPLDWCSNRWLGMDVVSVGGFAADWHNNVPSAWSSNPHIDYWRISCGWIYGYHGCNSFLPESGEEAGNTERPTYRCILSNLSAGIYLAVFGIFLGNWEHPILWRLLLQLFSVKSFERYQRNFISNSQEGWNAAGICFYCRAENGDVQSCDTDGSLHGINAVYFHIGRGSGHRGNGTHFSVLQGNEPKAVWRDNRRFGRFFCDDGGTGSGDTCRHHVSFDVMKESE